MAPTATAARPDARNSERPKLGLTNAKVAYYAAHDSWRQVKSNIPTYCLGVWTCFVAITVAATMHSVLEQSPVTYLASAEMETGQIDIMIFPSNYAADFLNYSRCEQKLDSTEASDNSFHAPRFKTTGSLSLPQTTTQKGLKVSLYAIDTEREQKAGIGRQWQLPKLGYGEVYISQKMAVVLGVAPGDKLNLDFDVGQLLSKFGSLPSKNTTEFFTKFDPSTKRFSGCKNQGCNCNKNSIEQNQCLLCGTVNDGTRCGVKSQIRVQVTLKAAVKGGWDGKVSSGVTDAMFMEYEHVFSMLWNEGLQTPRSVRKDFSKALSGLMPTPPDPMLSGGYYPSDSGADRYLVDSNTAKTIMHQYATEMIVMVPPSKRNLLYIQPNYDAIQSDMVKFASSVINAIGATDALDFETPVTRDLRENRFTSMYLALMLNVLIFILAVLSIILIYSLLMINVQKRTFEIAIRRMLGTRRDHVVILLCMQALSYSVPALVLGMPVAHFLTIELMTAFSTQVGIDVAGGLGFSGVFYGLLLGALIPLVASVGPISLALRTQLINALDARRPKVQGVKFSIEYGDQAGNVNISQLIIGGCLTLYGFIIYYFLPLALLSFNVSIFGTIFLIILLGMLFGLALLSLNLERPAEFGVMSACFRCCIKRSLRNITLKNLVAHRQRNMKTSIMYAMSLSFIIMVNVFSFIQLQSFEYYLRQSRGSALVIFGVQKTSTTLAANALRYNEMIAFTSLMKNDTEVADSIKDVGWVTVPLNEILRDFETRVSNAGQIFFRDDARIVAASPNYFDVAEPTFLSVYNEWNWGEKMYSKGLQMLEELHTVRGSQECILPSSYENALYIAKSNTNGPNPVSFHMKLGSLVSGLSLKPYRKVYNMIPKYMLNNAAGLRMAKYSSRRQNVLVSLPEYLTFASGIIRSIEDVPIRKIVVRLKPGLSVDKIDTIAKTLASAIGKNNVKGNVFNLNDRLKQIESIVTTINFFFAALTAVGMTLCFFSLLASMIANIAEQTKDIAILRSLGLAQIDIILIFVLEAFILVIASSFLGSIAGYTVAWTISSQRALVTQVPVSGYFPFEVAMLIIALALLFGVMSAAFPAKFYARQYIAKLLRG